MINSVYFYLFINIKEEITITIFQNSFRICFFANLKFAKTCLLIYCIIKRKANITKALPIKKKL